MGISNGKNPSAPALRPLSGAEAVQRSCQPAPRTARIRLRTTMQHLIERIEDTALYVLIAVQSRVRKLLLLLSYHTCCLLCVCFNRAYKYIFMIHTTHRESHLLHSKIQQVSWTYKLKCNTAVLALASAILTRARLAAAHRPSSVCTICIPQAKLERGFKQPGWARRK